MGTGESLKDVGGRWIRASRWASASAWATVMVCAPALAEPRLTDGPAEAAAPAEPVVVAVANLPATPARATAEVSSTAAGAPAPTTSGAAEPPVPADAVAPRSPYALPTDWRARAALDLKRPAPAQRIGLSIVELPAEGVPGARTRPRHALSISSDTPRRMLRSMGIEATDCATRFRMPTKLRRDADGGSNIEVRATLGLACNF